MTVRITGYRQPVALAQDAACLRDKLNIAVVFITHDLAPAKYFAWEGWIGVIYNAMMGGDRVRA